MLGDLKKAMGLMKQLGISQERVDADKVIIEAKNKKIIVDKPEIVKIKIQGQESFQISGDISEEEISDKDVKTIMEKTKCSEEEARKALEKAKGDLAEAIISLSNKNE